MTSPLDGVRVLDLTQVMAGVLFGVTARDPLAFVLVPLVLGAVGLQGVRLPSRRAARDDPVLALRSE